MSSRGPYRRHAAQFKLRMCQEICSVALGRRDARTKCSLSANVIQRWLTQCDRSELDGDEVEATVLADYEAGRPGRLPPKLSPTFMMPDSGGRVLRSRRLLSPQIGGQARS